MSIYNLSVSPILHFISLCCRPILYAFLKHPTYFICNLNRKIFQNYAVWLLVKESHLFISDIHLGLQSPELEKVKERKLVNFLQYARVSAKELFIVGDLFDYWFEYRHVYPKGFFRTLTALQDLSESGTRIHYIIGNHDFFHRDFFVKEIGCALYENPIDVIIEGKRFHIAHGDGLLKKDVGYRILKSVLRNKFFQDLFSLVHPDLGIAMASKTSKTSREYTAHKDYGEIDGMFTAAKQIIDNGYDYVIFGHSHKKQMINYKNGIYINLGSWLSEPAFACYARGEMKIINYSEIFPQENSDVK